jgi:hypothetical protein
VTLRYPGSAAQDAAMDCSDSSPSQNPPPGLSHESSLPGPLPAGGGGGPGLAAAAAATVTAQT